MTMATTPTSTGGVTTTSNSTTNDGLGGGGRSSSNGVETITDGKFISTITTKRERDRERDRDRENGATPAAAAATTTTQQPQHPPGMMVFDGYQQRSVKRPRPVKSCTECRSRKLRCSRLMPCAQCQKGHRICKYASDQALTTGSTGQVSDGGSDDESVAATGTPSASTPSSSRPGAGASSGGTERPAQKRKAAAALPRGDGDDGGGGRPPPPPRQLRPSLGEAAASLSPRDKHSSSFTAINGSTPAASTTSSNGVFVDEAAAQYYKSGIEDIASRLDRLERAVLASQAGSGGGSGPTPVQTPGPGPIRASAPMDIDGAGLAGLIGPIGHATTSDPNAQHLGGPSGLAPPPPPPTSGISTPTTASMTGTATILPPAARPLSSSRVATWPVTVRGLTIKGSASARTRFFGQNSTRVLLNLFDEAKDFMYNKAKRESAQKLFLLLQNIYTALQDEQRKSLAPITVFVDSVLPVLRRMADILPKKAVCDRLLDAYVGTSEGLYRVVHVPTFRAEYQAYWDSGGPATGPSTGTTGPAGGTTGSGAGGAGGRCSEGFLPQLLCMLSIGSRFETESRGLGRDRSEGVHVPTACALVRAWLDGLRGKQLVDVGTLLAEVLLLHAQRMIAPRFQDSWTQLGLIVRMAMTMGLHRDPSEFARIPPFAAESRRKLWYTIMDMDLHISLGCNLPCAVRDGEYTCRPPLNLDDEELLPDAADLPPPRAIDVRTDGQLQAFAAKTLPIRMRAAGLVSRLDTIRDYTEVLEIGSKLEQLLDDINCLFPRNQSLDPRGKYKEWRMRALLDMHIRRPLLALYRPFALSTPDCPQQISSAYLKSSMVLLTYMDELDARTPGFADVSHMYHIVLKYDIIQAAFSVCYYIKTAHETNAAGSGSGALGTPAATPQPSSGGGGGGGGGAGGGQYGRGGAGWNVAMSPGSSDGGLGAPGNSSAYANSSYAGGTNHLGGNNGNPYFDAATATTAGSSAGNGHAHGHSHSNNNSNSRPMIWSAERMTRVVEKTLEDLILFIRDSTSDLKDIIALSIVIKSVQPGGTPEQRLERIKDGIRRISDACMLSLSGTSVLDAILSAGSGGGGGGGGGVGQSAAAGVVGGGGGGLSGLGVVGALGSGSVFPPAPAVPVVDSRTSLPDQPFVQASAASSGLPFDMSTAGDGFQLWDMDFWTGSQADPT